MPPQTNPQNVNPNEPQNENRGELQNPAQEQQQAPSSPKGKGLIWTLITVIIVFLAAGGYFYVTNSSTISEQATDNEKAKKKADIEGVSEIPEGWIYHKKELSSIINGDILLGLPDSFEPPSSGKYPDGGGLVLLDNEKNYTFSIHCCYSHSPVVGGDLLTETVVDSLKGSIYGSNEGVGVDHYQYSLEVDVKADLKLGGIVDQVLQFGLKLPASRRQEGRVLFSNAVRRINNGEFHFVYEVLNDSAMKFSGSVFGVRPPTTVDNCCIILSASGL